MVHWIQFLVTAAVLLSCICQRTATDYDWDYFVFTQEWPTAMCIYAREQKHTCVVPRSVQTWTIHGLWPDKKYTEGPLACNKTWHFNPDKITSILPQLNKYWPNLFPNTSQDSFWKHEWEKHGTCSTNLKATHNELLYFKAALEQRQKYDLQKLLKEKGIVPSETETYTVSRIWKVLKDSLGVRPNITCVSHDGNSYLGQIKICLDKSFNLLDCGVMKTARNISSKFNDFLEGCRHGEETNVYYTLPPSSPWQQQIGIILA